MSQLQKGDHGIVIAVGQSNSSLRLMEMGIVPGANVEVQAFSPFGDSIAIRVANYTLSVRRNDVDAVHLNAV